MLEGRRSPISQAMFDGSSQISFTTGTLRSIQRTTSVRNPLEHFRERLSSVGVRCSTKKIAFEW